MINAKIKPTFTQRIYSSVSLNKVKEYYPGNKADKT